MKYSLYLVDWTPPEVLGPFLTKATGQVLEIENAVMAGRVEGSGWAFPQHQPNPDTNIIWVACPEANVAALQAIVGIQLLHEIPAPEIAGIVPGAMFACYVGGKRRMSRRSWIATAGLGCLAVGLSRANAAETTKPVVKADKDKLKLFLEGKKHDTNPKLTAAQKVAWSKTEIARVVDDAGNTDTKKLAGKLAKSAMFGWLDQTCRNVGLA